ncbi:uncharacterized protein LOC8277583 isoform X1 [Ricinus communis]|uniref:uncharacterized protein LOC8277583 isoform X1 n=1 Tax=Ricinus communis TaxID=3988 RepID=UPI000772A728|nr:uncharacterized protein LOC8277583 isoform X1 [Ricinus communis]|eukprot:XP_015580768.1 uncharacterized protein LOC8277583 isoform X1 [Ricinus communis]
MEAAVSSSLILTSPLNTKTLSRNRVITGYPKSTRTFRLIKNRKLTTTIAAVNEVSAAADSGQVEVTWQIIVGAVAGVTPFVVAGIEFSKRIIAQRRCEICGGAGLVMREKDYFRCPGCGGFLPWQSWKRFFSG